MAAGLTIKESDFESFSISFIEVLENHISLEDMQDEFVTDGELSSNDLSMIFAEEIQAAGPWGQLFPEPVFEGEFKIINKRIVGSKHLKLTLQVEENSRTIDAIAFNMTDEDWPHDVENIFSLYRLGINDFRGNSTLQLFVEYIEPL
jgi:single-stranded-DNA-specific exonuclease